MGTPSMYGSFVLDAELDCAWATMDVRIFYTNHSDVETNIKMVKFVFNLMLNHHQVNKEIK